MSIRPKYSLEESRPKATRQFTDREEFIAVFQQALKGIKPDEQNVVVFYGVGGIGKTSLRKELGRLIDKEHPTAVWAMLDFNVPQYREQETALFTLRKALGEKYKLSFPSFDLAYAVYWQKTHPQTALTKESFPLLDAGGIVTDIVGLFGVIPGIGLIPKVSNLVIKGKKALEDWWTKRGNKELYNLPQMEPKDIIERLPMFWAADLQDGLEQKNAQAVLFIDTYEALWEKERTEGAFFNRDEWVREVVAQLPGILWIVCGRERLRWEEVKPDWGNVLFQHLMGGLAEEDSIRFLHTCGIEDRDIQRTIVEGSKGVPYYLDLAIDTFFEIKERHQKPPTASDFTQNHREVLERFLLYLDRSEIETLKVLSAARQWDKAIFELLVVQFKTGYPLTALPELCRFSFISQGDQPDTWLMHELMREGLQEKLTTESRKTVHKWLFEFYNKELQEIDLKNVMDKQKNALKEALYQGKTVFKGGELLKWFISVANSFSLAAQWKPLIAMYETITPWLEDDLGAEHPDVATSLQNTAKLYAKLGKYDEAKPLYERALEIKEKALGPNHPELATTLALLGQLLWFRWDYVKAEFLCKRALEIQEKALKPETRDLAETLCTLGSIYSELGKFNEAEVFYKRGLEIVEKVSGFDHPDTAVFWGDLGFVCKRQGKFSDAIPLYKRALEINEKTLGLEHPAVASDLDSLSGIYIKEGNLAEGEMLIKRAINIKEKSLGPEHPDLADSLMNLAGVYYDQKKYAEAEILCKKALGIRENALGTEHSKVADILEDMGNLYKKTGREEEAKILEERVLRIRNKIQL